MVRRWSIRRVLCLLLIGSGLEWSHAAFLEVPMRSLAIKIKAALGGCTLRVRVSRACLNHRTHLLHCEEHAPGIACEERETKALVP